MGQFLEALRRVRARLKELDSGDAQALMEEIKRLGALVGDSEAGYWVSCVGERSRSAEGRAELVQKGFLEKEHLHLPNPADVARRASLIALRYRVNKRLQRHLSAAGLLSGIADVCVLPTVLRNPGARELMDEASCDTLVKDRLAVVDGVFPGDVMLKVRSELQALRGASLLQSDSNDVCNPRQESRYLPYGKDEPSAEFRKSCPVTMQVVERITGLPAILEETLGLRLAVPESVMVACYPPRASYKMHLDSYVSQGVEDDVPRKVTILLYCNHGWSKSVGGQLRTWAPNDQGKGPSKLIDPLAGRLVVFMSEEIWHEVTEAFEDRFALTLWVHDRDRAELKQGSGL